MRKVIYYAVIEFKKRVIDSPAQMTSSKLNSWIFFFVFVQTSIVGGD